MGKCLFLCITCGKAIGFRDSVPSYKSETVFS